MQTVGQQHRHGQAAALDLLHLLTDLNGPYGAYLELTTHRAEDLSTDAIAAYLDAFAYAAASARAGFLSVMAAHLINGSREYVVAPGELCPRSLDGTNPRFGPEERDANGRLWLSRSSVGQIFLRRIKEPLPTDPKFIKFLSRFVPDNR